LDRVRENVGERGERREREEREGKGAYEAGEGEFQ